MKRYPLKAVKVMHTVALRTESSLKTSTAPPVQFGAFKVFSLTLDVAAQADALLHGSGFVHYPFKIHIQASWLPNFCFNYIQNNVSGHLTESYGRHVCFPCHYYGQYASYANHCIYKNWIHVYSSEPLSAFINDLCLHK